MSDISIVTELARVKVAFQARTITTILTARHVSPLVTPLPERDPQ